MGSLYGHHQTTTLSIGRMCTTLVYLFCTTAVSLAASTSRESTDVGGQALSSLTSSLNPSPMLGDSMGSDPDLNPSWRLSDRPPTTRPRHRHGRRKKSNKQGGAQRGNVISNAADSTNGITIRVDSAQSGWNNPGVIASTPDRPRSSLRNGNEQETISLCPNCGLRDENGNTVHKPLNRDDMTRIRIETVKQQILDKLRLSKPPQVNISNLHVPAPLNDGQIPDLEDQVRGEELSHHGDTIHGNQGEESYYGKTTKIIIQAEQDEAPCWSGTSGGRCFTFHFSSSNTHDNIQSAQLWVYWNGSVFSDPSSVDPTMSITVDGKATRHHEYTAPIRTNDLSNIGMVGWLTFDLKHSVRRWHKHNIVEHSIHVKCEHCEGAQDQVVHALSASAQRGFAPFIVIHTSKGKRSSRVRRSDDCTYIGSSTCCKERLYIRFRDIGWDWIIMPQGFQANFCRGICHLSTNLHNSNTGLMATIYNERNRAMRTRGIEFETCCSPKSMAPLEMMYVNDENVYTKVTVPDMTIESCGCSF